MKVKLKYFIKAGKKHGGKHSLTCNIENKELRRAQLRLVLTLNEEQTGKEQKKKVTHDCSETESRRGGESEVDCCVESRERKSKINRRANQGNTLNTNDIRKES